jgi:enoyl-CoA hydratase
MPHIVGQGITREMAYTAEPMDAQRALAINLVNRVFADQDAMLAAAREMALKIAANAPLSVQGSKEVLNFGRGKTIADSLEYVAARSSMILPSDDMAETLTAFMEKRPPNFTGK